MPSTEHGWPSVLARLSSPSAGSAVREAHLERISIMSPSILPSIGCDLSVAPQGRVSGQGLQHAVRGSSGGAGGASSCSAHARASLLMLSGPLACFFLRAVVPLCCRKP